jgi:hypothetical protein
MFARCQCGRRRAEDKRRRENNSEFAQHGQGPFAAANPSSLQHRRLPNLDMDQFGKIASERHAAGLGISGGDSGMSLPCPQK